MSEIENQEVNEEVSEETEEHEDVQEKEQAALEAEKQRQAIVAEESKARDTGWRPKKEFKGKNWRPANEWNERGDEYIPFIKAELRGTKEKLTGLEDENKTLKSTVKKLTTVSDKFREDFYGKNIADLEEQELAAVEEGDTEAFQRIREQKAKIEKPETVTETETTDETGQEPIENPDFERWKKENTWIDTDPVLGRYAVALANELESKGEKGNDYAFFEKVGQEVKTTFPGKFKNPKQNSSDMVESSIRGTEPAESGNGDKGWDDLPAEAKQQCKKLMAEDEGYTKEDYLKYYPFDEE